MTPHAGSGRPQLPRPICPSDESYIHQLRAGYYAAITHMDHQIGRLISALVEQQLMDNTVILFVSDHGRCWATT